MVAKRDFHSQGHISFYWKPRSVAQVRAIVGDVIQYKPLESRPVIEEVDTPSSEPDIVNEQDFALDVTPLAASKSQRKLPSVLSGEKRRRGRPRKIKQPIDSSLPKRPRGRPKKGQGASEGARLATATSWHLLPVDMDSEEGIQTRARRAFIRCQQAGMIFDCPEEDAIRGLALQFRARC